MGNFSLATTADNVFNGTVLNDILLTSQSNQTIWIGGASGACNVLSIGSNVTSTSNLEVTGTLSNAGGGSFGGMVTMSNLTLTGSVVGFNGVSSNQSFSNVWSSNVYGSNAAFCNVTLGSLSSTRFIVGNFGPQLAPPTVLSQIVGVASVAASNASFSNISIGSNTFVDNNLNLSNVNNINATGQLSCSNIFNKGRLIIRN
jgi:hypothetical protein